MITIYNVSLNPEKSLVENLENEVKDCDVMIEIFSSRCSDNDVKAYELRKAYLEKLIKEIKGND